MRYAIVNATRDAIVGYVEPKEGETVLPIEDETETPGPGQIQGDRVREIIEAGRVVRLLEAVRALSGMVAILNPDGTIAGTKNLGEKPVAVGEHVLPVEDVKPKLGKGKQYGAPVLTVEGDKVLATYPVEDIPPPPPEPTAAEKLAAAGLTVGDLRKLLAEHVEPEV